MPHHEPFELTPDEAAALLRIANSQRGEHRLVNRARAVLDASRGGENRSIARRHNVSERFVGKWRHRFVASRIEHPDWDVAKHLSDAKRVGRPSTFDEAVHVDIIALATTDPSSLAVPVTHWTLRELTGVLVERNVVPPMHFTTVWRILDACKLKPHRSRYWLNRKNDPEFEERCKDVKALLVDGPADPERAVLSFDEMTGVQAKNRIAPDKPMKPGRPAQLEFEYERNGTLCLFGLMLINTGSLIAATRPNRPNDVTASVISESLQGLQLRGYKRFDITLDQLNTHWSIDMVDAVAAFCGLPPLFRADVASGAQRRAWLESSDKPVVFHFTPKHASWLNPIEIWFGVLARKVLRRGSFKSTEDLAERIDRFVRYYNEKLALPYLFSYWRTAA